MRPLLLLFLTSFVVSCGTVTPRDNIAIDNWIAFDHKTSYFARETGEDSVYLTVKYGSYTLVDKSPELIPIAKSVFQHIANDLAKKHGKPFPVYDVSTFYESVAFDGFWGISKVLVSNDIKFTDNIKDSNVNKGVNKDSIIVEKLENLKVAFEKGLITKQEYEQKKKQILEQY